MRRGILFLSFAFLVLVGSCTKQQTGERRSKELTGKTASIPLNSLIPELEGLEVEHSVYCLSSEPMVFDTTYSTGRYWLPAHTQSGAVNLRSFTISAPFEEAVQTECHADFSVAIPDFQWDDDWVELRSGTAEGTVTLHFSYPESFPFERIYLQYADIFTPDFIGLDYANDSPVRIDRHEVHVWSDWEIPRSGRDLTMKVSSLRMDSMEVQENGRGTLNGSLVGHMIVSVKPEDAIGDVSGAWDQVPLEIGFSTSDIDLTWVTGSTLTQPEPDRKPVCFLAPFPTLGDSRLNHFSEAQVILESEIDDSGTGAYASEGWKLDIFTRRGTRERSFSVSNPYRGRYIYVADRNAFGHGEYTEQIAKGLNGLVTDPVPEYVGFTVKNTVRNDLVWPNQTYHRKYSVRWRIPLRLPGVDWQKEIVTEPFILSAKELEAVPGSIIHIGFIFENAQPFELSGYPVVIDADGNHHELKDKAFRVEGGCTLPAGELISDFDWTAEEPSRRIQVYFKLQLGKCSELYGIGPGMGIHYGLTFISKEYLQGQN